MRYLMVYRPDANVEVGCSSGKAAMEEMGRFTEELTSAGILLETGGLHPIAKGARVRLATGSVTVTDGANAEGTGLISGFAIVRVGSKDEAVELAERFLKIAGDGETEIRLLFEPSDFGVGCEADLRHQDQRLSA